MELEVLVVGGGIAGVGALHDLVSRGVRRVRLVERARLAAGTSSRSTKLLHGGLRYLEHLGQWGLVREALRERTLLSGLLGGEVRPLSIVIPCEEGGRPPWMVRVGLCLYGALAGRSTLPRPRRLGPGELRELVPYLGPEAERRLRAAFLYHDLQMRDDAVVRAVAACAVRLGARVSEHTAARAVRPIGEGFAVELEGPAGLETVTARAVVNAAGPWCNANLLRWGFVPRTATLLDVGSHLLFRASLTRADPDRSAATLVQNDDGRIVFFLPWFGQWLLGTTESLLVGDPDGLGVPEEDRAYLLRAARTGLGLERPEDHLAGAFAGVRTIPVGPPSLRPHSVEEAWRRDPFGSPFYLRRPPPSLPALSREAVVDEAAPGLVSVYGGKYTTYRAESERLGDHLCRRLGVATPSRTARPESWCVTALREASPELLGTDASLWG